MKIALISRRYPPLIGGAERVLSYLAEGFAAEGAEVTVLTSKPAELRGLPSKEIVFCAEGIHRLIRLPSPPIRIVGTWLYMKKLKNYLDSQEIDLIYVSMLKHDAYAALEIGKKRRIPVVLRPEGAGATGDVAWQSWGRFGAAIAKRCKTADAFVSISERVTAELEAAGYPASKIKGLPNGVPIPPIRWKLRQGWKNQPLACYVGRLAPEKGLDTLVEAWPIVLETFPKARLRLIGEGPERLRLEASVKALRLEDVITLPGSIPDPVADLRMADLFVLPSREEGMSIALLEALALGIPIVATSISGNQRLVVDGVQGRLVDVDDPVAMAEGIVNQWSSFQVATKMAINARQRVIDEFSIRAVARRHLELFQALIDQKRCEVDGKISTSRESFTC